MLACTVQAKPEIIEMFFAVVQHISAKSPFRAGLTTAIFASRRGRRADYTRPGNDVTWR
jgi:hypothetical protein